jgi:Hus1-like protein
LLIREKFNMRFKAELASEQLHLLYSLIGPISKISSQAVIYLDPEYLRLSSRDADGISCFAELKTHGGIFLSHRIESVADNAIVFEIDLLQWKSAIQSVIGERHDGPYSCQTNSASDGHTSGGSGPNDTHAMSLHTTTMKLAKRHGGIPCLCLDGKCHGSAAFEVYHAIPVRIMRAGDIQYVGLSFRFASHPFPYHILFPPSY